MQKYLLVFEKLLFGLSVVLLAFIPLYPKFPFLNVSGTFVAIRAEDILIALSLALWIIYLFLSGKIKDFFWDKLNQVILLFFFVGGVSLFSAVYLTHTATLSLGLFHYFRRVEFILLMPFVISVFKTKKQIISSLILLSVVTLVVNLYAMGQQYLNWPVISTNNSEFSKGLILYLTPDARVNSTFAGHYDLAVYLVMVLTIIASLFFFRKNILLKLWMLILALLSFFVLVLTAARLSFIAAIAGIIISLLLTGKKILIGIVILGAIVALVYPSQLRDRFLSTVTINLMQEGQRYFAQTPAQQSRNRLNIPTLPVQVSSTSANKVRNASQSSIPSDIAPGEPLNSTDLGVYRSFAIRLNLEWPRAIRAFIKNPILGTGYSSNGIATDNDILRSLGEVGLLGTLALLFILVEVLKRLWKVYKSQDKFLKYFSAGLISLVIAFVINGIFIDVFEASKVAELFWMILGVGLSAVKKDNV